MQQRIAALLFPLLLVAGPAEIEPPSLLSIPIKNEIPVRVEMTWKQS